jgi:prepilin-type N-terminal cleavage/methylation domain-containing protein
MRRSSSGFTLIELLVAIMILTLFMTAAMGAVRIASKSTTAGVVRADTTAAAVRAAPLHDDR